MIDSRYVATVKWDKELGERLRILRGEMSRRELSQRTEEIGRLVTHQYIQQLEQPQHQLNRINSEYLTVSWDVIQVLCSALKIEITDLFTNSARIFIE